MATSLTIELARAAIKEGGTIYLKRRDNGEVHHLKGETVVHRLKQLHPKPVYREPEVAFRLLDSDLRECVYLEKDLGLFDYVQNVHHVPAGRG